MYKCSGIISSEYLHGSHESLQRQSPRVTNMLAQTFTQNRQVSHNWHYLPVLMWWSISGQRFHGISKDSRIRTSGASGFNSFEFLQIFTYSRKVIVMRAISYCHIDFLHPMSMCKSDSFCHIFEKFFAFCTKPQTLHHRYKRHLRQHEWRS